jgi:hypothetical protein
MKPQRELPEVPPQDHSLQYLPSFLTKVFQFIVSIY